MSRAIGVLLLLSGALGGQAQHLSVLRDHRVDLNTDSSHVVLLEAQADYNANTVYNELPLAILNGGFLERTLRQRTADALSAADNTLGYILEGRSEYRGKPCAKYLRGWRPLVSVAYHDLASARFTEDQYKVAFFGNAAYQGTTAVLAPTAFEQIRYQTIGTGVMHNASGSFVRVDLVRGQSFVALDIPEATLFTGEDGELLRTTLVGNYWASDTSGSSLQRHSGLGVALSGRWQHRWNVGERAWTVNAGVDDLGFVVWNSNTVGIRKDTLFTYNGWNVPNLFALDDVLINENVALDTFGLRYAKGEEQRLLPFRASASLHTSLSTGWLFGLAVEQRYLPGYVPQASVLASKLIGQRTVLGGTVTYGGFGTWRVGLAAQRRFGEHVTVHLSTPQAPGWVSGKMRGLGLLCGVGISF